MTIGPINRIVRMKIHYHLDVEHIVHSQCTSGVLVEHYGLEFGGHSWPNEVPASKPAVNVAIFIPVYELIRILLMS